MLTGSQLIKKFPVFYGTRRFTTTFTNARLTSYQCAKIEEEGIGRKRSTRKRCENS